MIKGEKLQEVPALSPTPWIDSAALSRALSHYAPAVAVTILDETASTNTLAKSEAHISAPALYIARTQTGGRGRLGRSFHSPADTGLYMTVSYTTDKPLTEAVRVTAAAAVAASTAIEALTGIHTFVKWVNDLYRNGAKVGGILTEAVTLQNGSHRMVVGLGINLSTAEFPAGLRAPAASLFPSDSAAVTPRLMGSLAGEITRRLLELANPTEESDLPDGMWGSACLEIYRRRLLYVDEVVVCTRGSETFEGVVRGVDSDYALLVETDTGVTPLSSGEISIRPVKKT